MNFNADTLPLFCPKCGKCMTEKDIPEDVLMEIGICCCG